MVSSRLFFVFLCFVSSTISVSHRDAKLVHSAVLDSDEKYRVFWNFDEKDIVFEVQVETLGYVGFGLSPNGGMPGSDIVTGGVYNGEGNTYFTDCHATGKQQPVKDVSQDWQLVSGLQNDTHTTLRFWRPLDSCDDDDRRIKPETARVIWAYGDEDADPEGYVSYHSGKRGSKSIFLLNQQKTVPEIPEDSLIVDFKNDKVEVPATDTTYWCQAFAIPEVDRKHHVIKVEPIIEAGHEWLVHHAVLTGCYADTTNETAGQGALCDDSNMKDAWKGCITMMFAWAVGGGPFYFPEHVGMPLGFEGDPALLVLETHYDNPNSIAGIVDSSGLRLTLSPRPRKYDAGTLATGVMVYKTQAIPPFMESFHTDGHCVPECLSQAMADQPDGINIIAGFPHAHLLGISIKTRHFRDGIEQEVISEDDNYDFDFQETRLLKNEVNVRPGDHLLTECYYRSTGRTKPTFGGISTRQEMCLNAMLYYPRIQLSACQSSIALTIWEDFANITLYPNNTVKEPRIYEGLHYYEFLEQHVDWSNQDTRRRFQEYTTAVDHSIHPMCYGDLNSIYPVSMKMIKVPEIKKTLPTENPCDGQTDGATKLTFQSMTCFAFVTLFTILI